MQARRGKGPYTKGAEKAPTLHDTNRYDSAQVGGRQGDLGRETPHTDKSKRPALIEIVRKLYSTIVPSAQSHGTRTEHVSASNQKICNILCLAVISHMEAYLALRYPGDQNSTDVQEADYDYMSFLLCFDKKMIQKMKLPVADKFTETMVLSPQDEWLPFGFQVLLESSPYCSSSTEKSLLISKAMALEWLDFYELIVNTKMIWRQQVASPTTWLRRISSSLRSS